LKRPSSTICRLKVKSSHFFGTPETRGEMVVGVHVYLDQAEVSNAHRTSFDWVSINKSKSSKAKNITGTAGSLLVLSQEND
jgi:hypothetical protein